MRSLGGGGQLSDVPDRFIGFCNPDGKRETTGS